ncbi:kinase [Sphingomonas sp.]|uniref:kinase n=1 Tax=Sphingomonas sp. TaxID=28214 RepID=UPI003D6D0A78
MEQQPMAEEETQVLRALFAEEQIPAAGDDLQRAYGTIAGWIIARREAADRPLLVGICGAQGSGKSTLALGLARLIEHRTELKVAALSIDDFYLPHAARQALAHTVHPLFATRGVPGTHDVALAERTIRRLATAASDAKTPLPRFDKASDDVEPQPVWPVFHGRADIILFEGWCVGARPETAAALVSPINMLERDEDPDGIWRRAVNTALAEQYHALFGHLDLLLMIAAPSFDTVFAWRGEQERKLAARARAAGKQTDAIMDDTALRRFISHYERLTRHILADMPMRADGVMTLDDQRGVEALRLG